MGEEPEGAIRMNLFGEDHQATIDAANKIRDILSNASVGWANENAKRQIEALIFSIRNTATDPYIREKAGNVESRIDILFSARKWQRHGGTQRVMSQILSACIASRAETLRRKADQEG